MKVVLANGVFDPLHYGHLRHLQAAKRMGDWLIVAVAADEAVNKGPGRPVFPEWQRAEMVKALRCVDRVIIVHDWKTALMASEPNIYVKGSDYDDGIPEADYCRERGIELKFTNEPSYSSTKLLRYYADLGAP